jgi:hypothetical protein
MVDLLTCTAMFGVFCGQAASLEKNSPLVLDVCVSDCPGSRVPLMGTGRVASPWLGGGCAKGSTPGKG